MIAIVWLSLCVEVFAHGRSEEMIRMLNAPVPEWMSLAEPIKAEPIDDQTLRDAYSFRPRSGGATNSRNRVHIPERGLEFNFDYSITWRGGSNEGHGVSLSPDGRRLLVNSGTTPHLYEIGSTGDLQKMPINLPHVTYDEGTKGFVTGWSWASNDVLVGQATITDETGHEAIEGRLYVFHMEEQALARLDLSALDLPYNAGIEIAGIGEDLEHLRIRLGDREFAVKADLKSPPRLLAKPDLSPIEETQSIAQTPESAKLSDATAVLTSPNDENDFGWRGEESPASTRWPVVAVMVVAVLALLRLLLKKRK